MSASPAPMNVPVGQSPSDASSVSGSSSNNAIKVNKSKVSYRKLLIGGAAVGAVCLTIGLSVGLSTHKATSNSTSTTSSASKDSGSVSTSTTTTTTTTTSSDPEPLCVLSEGGWSISNLNSQQFCVSTSFTDMSITQGVTEVDIPFSYLGTDGFVATLYSSTNVNGGLDCDNVGSAESMTHVECPARDTETQETEYGAQ
eukprot:TRINITY_DN2387_c0_g1_i1.p1 TRINITY_DN2387_c0_g1~~TRINITY_DN2387_c0_g1_i1.p1  ORF type:complete len:199 (-),score=40.73 TRINITY_DN2387_c0_g1_i1:134-730(-)